MSSVVATTSLDPIAGIDPGLSLASLATSRAGASRVFYRHGLDFCCGGHTDLASACSRAGLDVATVVAEIEAEGAHDEDFRHWEQRPVEELIAHILATYHDVHRDELPRLVAMARKVEEVHGDKPACPRGLADHLTFISEALEAHMRKEEEVLFPLLEAGYAARAHAPIHVMEEEHKDHAANLERLACLATSFQAPAGACATWRALYLELAEFDRRIRQHIHLENNVLFPNALNG